MGEGGGVRCPCPVAICSTACGVSTRWRTSTPASPQRFLIPFETCFFYPRAPSTWNETQGGGGGKVFGRTGRLPFARIRLGGRLFITFYYLFIYWFTFDLFRLFTTAKGFVSHDRVEGIEGNGSPRAPDRERMGDFCLSARERAAWEGRRYRSPRKCCSQPGGESWAPKSVLLRIRWGGGRDMPTDAHSPPPSDGGGCSFPNTPSPSFPFVRVCGGARRRPIREGGPTPLLPGPPRNGPPLEPLTSPYMGHWVSSWFLFARAGILPATRSSWAPSLCWLIRLIRRGLAWP